MCNSVRRRGSHFVLCLRKLIFTGVAILVCLGLFGHDRGRQKEQLRNPRHYVRNILQDVSLEDDNSDKQVHKYVTEKPNQEKTGKVVPKIKEKARRLKTKYEDILSSSDEDVSRKELDVSEEDGSFVNITTTEKPDIKKLRFIVPKFHEIAGRLHTKYKDGPKTEPMEESSEKGGFDANNDISPPPEKETVTPVPKANDKIERFKTKYKIPFLAFSTASTLFRPNPTTTNIKNTTVEFEEKCTPPAYHEFPPDLFNNYQRAHGAIIVHILVVFYMFYAVAVVCDDYFISSLEECCARLDMSEDVAGATFMAAGSSAPELFTAILGVLVAKGDVGTGTIVGSAVFNVLFVIGICGIFAGRVVTLSWWPITRDSVFYSFTVVVLIIIIYDSTVTWYESIIMLIIYAFYIVLMKFNSRVHFWISRKLGIEDESTAAIGILSQTHDNKCYSSYVPFNNEIDECAQTTITSQTTLTGEETVKIAKKRLTFFEAAQMMLMTSCFPPLTRFRAAGRRIILENQARRRSQKFPTQVSLDGGGGIPRWRSKSISASIVVVTEEDWKRIPSKEEGIAEIVKWLIRTPVLAVLYFTIPDCKKARWKNWFLVTFAMSITWTAVFSYIMVWMVTLAGFTLGIPDSIMGITFLAAGTSVPDAFASLIVARQGQGDMAVSNSIGSNVFDILVGLAVPWFIYTAMIEPGEMATINSRGMVYSVVLLFLTIIVTVGGVYVSQWQLTKRLGILLLTIYVVFLVISCMIEFNCFGYVNPPMCEE